MILVVYSHKLVWSSDKSSVGYATDGGFAFHMKAISELFDKTYVVVPYTASPKPKGEVAFEGNNITIVPLPDIDAVQGGRKLRFPIWLLKNFPTIMSYLRKSDAVHVPIPSDMGTIPMVLAKLLGKYLFVRHCGNWYIQATKAEKFWKWFMEKYAGGKNVFLATGGSNIAPSEKNKNIKWIFSTSLTKAEIEHLLGKNRPIKKENPKLIIACRQERLKGTEKVLFALKELKATYPKIHFDILGDGPHLPKLEQFVNENDLQDNVTFHGKVNHDRVIELMQAADIFAYPTQASEGFPKVVLEALATGLPVITNPVSVLPSLLSEGGGIILEQDTTEYLKKAIESLVENESEFLEMQRKAQITSMKYTLENWRDTIGSHLQENWNKKTKD